MDRGVECKNTIVLESSTMAMVGHSEAQVEEDSSGRNAGERRLKNLTKILSQIKYCVSNGALGRIARLRF